MAIAAFKILNETSNHTSFDQEQLWKHSLKSSLAGKMLSKKTGGVDPEISLIASLLHDIGKLILGCFLPTEYERDQGKIRKSDASIVEVEEEMLGFNLISYHNVYFMLELMREIREAIEAGSFQKLKKKWAC